MKKPAKHYKVYETESAVPLGQDPGIYLSGRFVGETYAVSEKQAINQVRHRVYGDYTRNITYFTGRDGVTHKLTFYAEEC